jgi:hypothetical protein
MIQYVGRSANLNIGMLRKLLLPVATRPTNSSSNPKTASEGLSAHMCAYQALHGLALYLSQVANVWLHCNC